MPDNMRIKCVWEHNGGDSLLYAENFIGAFSRGESKELALSKMEREVRSYIRFVGGEVDGSAEIEIVQEKLSDLKISDADSDVLFESEKGELSYSRYRSLKALALRSAQCFQELYESIPDKNKTGIVKRKTFYGDIPRTAAEMYDHTKNVNKYYFAEIGVEADNTGTILECRKRGFYALEKTVDYLENNVFDGSYGEEWTLKKLLRRFIWHDRIHAKAMYRMAIKTFGEDSVPNVFSFDI